MIDCNDLIFDKRIVIFAGAYGSGKTEVAVNYAIQTAQHTHDPVSIIDLDIVNPYFRSREAALEMEGFGIRPINPLGEHCHADLPIIVPQIKASIESSSGRVIIDVGGDDLGARVLSSMSDAFAVAQYEFLMVLNANRPFTSTVEGALKMLRVIENSARLKFTGIVSNTHLIGETTPQTVLDGITFSLAVAKAAEIPLVFASGMEEIIDKIDIKQISVPLFSLSRRMLKPWEHRKAVANNH
ncbi:MAG: cobalamin biosynthesis protein CbiA [Candidatus Zixiibacteriota bacterium]